MRKKDDVINCRKYILVLANLIHPARRRKHITFRWENHLTSYTRFFFYLSSRKTYLQEENNTRIGKGKATWRSVKSWARKLRGVSPAGRKSREEAFRLFLERQWAHARRREALGAGNAAPLCRRAPYFAQDYALLIRPAECACTSLYTLCS
jgi:hypothetical protein